MLDSVPDPRGVLVAPMLTAKRKWGILKSWEGALSCVLYLRRPAAVRSGNGHAALVLGFAGANAFAEVRRATRLRDGLLGNRDQPSDEPPRRCADAAALKDGWEAVESQVIGPKTERELDYVAAIGIITKIGTRSTTRHGSWPTKSLWKGLRSLS